jgi:hypothetical protein
MYNNADKPDGQNHAFCCSTMIAEKHKGVTHLRASQEKKHLSMKKMILFSNDD